MRLHLAVVSCMLMIAPRAQGGLMTMAQCGFQQALTEETFSECSDPEAYLGANARASGGNLFTSPLFVEVTTYSFMNPNLPAIAEAEVLVTAPMLITGIGKGSGTIAYQIALSHTLYNGGIELSIKQNGETAKMWYGSMGSSPNPVREDAQLLYQLAALPFTFDEPFELQFSLLGRAVSGYSSTMSSLSAIAQIKSFVIRDDLGDVTNANITQIPEPGTASLLLVPLVYLGVSRLFTRDASEKERRFVRRVARITKRFATLGRAQSI